MKEMVFEKVVKNQLYILNLYNRKKLVVVVAMVDDNKSNTMKVVFYID